mmetsp:Transcript_14431/g.42285  ORF Transcript_14431/g.42285 Transcript_14431/m.42285 type:complete len:174 (-) Transcript_14431:474-995(-)
MQGQNLITDEHRSEVVKWVQEGLPYRQINALIPDDNPLSLANQGFADFIRMSLAANNPTPCVGYNASFVGVIDKICDALIENDMTNHLEKEARYPINLCHSVEDDKVMYSNVEHLNLASNPFLSHDAVSGDHSDALVSCFLIYIHFLLSEAYSTSPVQFSENCAIAPVHRPNQ